MGHLNRPNQNEDDIPHDLTLEEEEIEDGEIEVEEGEIEVEEGEVEVENDVQEDARRYFNRAAECVWRQWAPPPQEPLLLPALPWNVTIIFPPVAVHQRPLSQSLSPFPYRSVLRPPSIGVRIPIIHCPQIRPQQGTLISVISVRTWYRGRPPFSSNHVQNLQFSDRIGTSNIQNIPPPRMPQRELRPIQGNRQRHRFPRSPSTTPPREVCYRNSAIAKRIHRRSAVKVARKPVSRSMPDFRSYKPRNRQREMNVKTTVENSQQVNNNDQEEEEEEDDDDDVDDVRRCEAYRDLHFDNDSDDDDNNGSHNALPNMQMLC